MMGGPLYFPPKGDSAAKIQLLSEQIIVIPKKGRSLNLPCF